STENPSWLIFRMLAGAVGLPFIALSATSPLLQAWLANSGSEEPYRLFAVSNFASLAALLAYPTLIEPVFGTRKQSVAWSLLYFLFAMLCAAGAWQARNANRPSHIETTNIDPPALRKLLWFALAACGSMLLLAITNHIDENLAAVPLMWILPLAVYLLSFVFSFGSLNLYKRSLWIRLLAFALGILGYAVYSINAQIAIQISLPVFLVGLFICCAFCHGELNQLRPRVQDLTGFYLFIAAGGAAGAIFVGLMAPMIFNGVYELPLALLFSSVLALVSTWSDRNWVVIILWAAVSACMVAVAVMNVKAYRENSLSLRRSFYGSLRVVQTPHAGPDQQRILFHGTIEHGSEFLLPPRRSRPTTYYGPDSGIGIVLREGVSSPKRVGVIGLGAGTLAYYGHPGDQFQFYEINSQVLDIAQALFFYLRESHARIATTIGDGRMSLEREHGPPFDVLVLDAFSGDAIPIHLLTREALSLYLRHLVEGGVIAFHVSNDFLDLAPVVGQLAADAGYRAVLVHNHEESDEAILAADWVLVTNNQAVLQNPAITIHARAIINRPGLRLWTDDYNDLLSILKTPELRRGAPR
ncbi:MAG: fused MFS/spermidine synthase, partial [Acidobacteriaceae bacterium]|nr:fused MFS/spermidine synthase [Acidobacteriaceae bacterium]